jgi:hypothetical protein
MIVGAALAGALCISAQPAAASVLYSNGPVNGELQGWNISQSFATADSFTLAKASTLTGVKLWVWTLPGDVASSLYWGISSAPNTYPADGQATVTSTFQFKNAGGWDISQLEFALPSVQLGAGTHYLALQLTSATNNDPVYWDQNNGPSSAYFNTIGDVSQYQGAPYPGGSEAFQVQGVNVPEPAAWAMMLVGFGALGAALRARRKAGSALAA